MASKNDYISVKEVSRMNCENLREPTPELLAAFRRIYDKTCKNVRGKLVYTFGEGDPTDDLFQETYTAIWEVLLKCGDEKVTEKQVYSVARNKRVDHLRRKYPEREKVVPLDDEDNDTLNFADSDEICLPGAVLMNMENQKEIREIINRLPVQQKIVCKLFYSEACSVKEISEQLGIAEGTVKAHLAKARNTLKKMFLAEARNGNKLYGAVGTVALGEVLQRGMEQSSAAVPVELTEKVLAVPQIGTAATAATGTAAMTAAGASTASTITTGAGILGKIAALTAGTKAALAVAAAVVVVGGGGAAYVQHENAVKQAEAAALVQQQEEQARLNAEQAARESAEKRAKEEQAARQAEAERIAAEQAKAEETARQAEAERIAAEEAKAEAEAEEAARKALEAEQAAAAQAPTIPGNGPEGADGLPSTGPVEETPSGGNGDRTGMNDEYVGKPEPDYRQTGAKNAGPVKRGEAQWDSSLGGWTYQGAMGTRIIYPNGNSARLSD